MSKFVNKQGITNIEITHNVQCYCPLGDDWYTNHLCIKLEGLNVIPDYCDVDDFIRSLSGKKLIIEDVVSLIYEYIVSEYNPEHINVESYVSDAKHMPVKVVKSS